MSGSEESPPQTVIGRGGRGREKKKNIFVIDPGEVEGVSARRKSARGGENMSANSALISSRCL